jgi:hypothetical protein
MMGIMVIIRTLILAWIQSNVQYSLPFLPHPSFCKELCLLQNFRARALAVESPSGPARPLPNSLIKEMSISEGQTRETYSVWSKTTGRGKQARQPVFGGADTSF